MLLLDLFCGCGGFALGARQAGMRTALAVDVDPILSFPYLMNASSARLLLTDIAKLKASHIRTYVGPIDGMFGGPPCQAFSNIGLRDKADTRRNLLVDFFKLVKELRPPFFVMENVPGLGQGEAKALLEFGISQVSNYYNLLGPIILDAADFGAATRRERLFVIGMEKNNAEAVTKEDIEKLKKRPVTVKQAIGDLKGAAYLRDDDREYDVWKIDGRRTASDYAKRLQSKSGEFTGHRVTEHTADVKRRFSKVQPGKIDKIGRHPRLAWDSQCPTLRAGTGTERGSFQSVRPIHPEEDRVITVREAARLQGFPDDFRFHPTTWHSFRMIGNSVSPIIAHAIFSVIAQKIDTRRFLAAAE